MKKINLLKWGFLCLFCMLGTFVWAADDDETTTESVEVTLPNTDVVTCTFLDKVVSNTDYFAVSGSCGNDSKYGNVVIGGTTYNAYFKFTTSNSITFTTTEANTDLTIVFGPYDKTNTMPFTISINGSEQTVSDNVFTYTCESAGKYEITTAKECHVFYIGVTAALAEITYDPVVLDEDDIVCWFTDGSPTNTTDFTFESSKYGNDSATYGSVVINGETITGCLRLESSTKVTFTTSVANTVLTLVFGETETTPNVKIDGEKETGTSNVMQITLAEAGTHTIEKSDAHQIFYIGLSVPSDGTTTATWDYVNTIPSDIASYSYEGTAGYIPSEIDGVKLYIDATASDAKLGAGTGNAQFLTGTIMRIPVLSEDDVVSFTGYSGLTYTVDGGSEITATGSAMECTVSSTDVERGYLEIVSTGGYSGGYILALSVTYAADDDLNTIDYDKIAAGDGSDEEEGDDEEEGVTKVTVYESEDSAEALSYDSNGGYQYFSFTIPEYEGTLTIDNGLDHLYTELASAQSDAASNSGENGIEGSFVSGDKYSWSGLTPGAKYYAWVNSKYSGGSITATYEATSGGETTDYNITLISSTDVSEGLAKLEEGVFTLTISADNLEDGNAIRLDAYSDSENEDDQILFSMQWFTASDTEGQYTWTPQYDIELKDGLTYTFYATPYTASQGGSALGDQVAVLTVEGKAVHTQTSLTANPTNNGTITPDGDSKTIELTFGTAVNITSAQIALNGGNYEDVTISEGTDASTTWTLTITDTQLTNDKDDEGNITIIIYATDTNGEVYDEEGNTYFELKYAVGEAAEPTAWSDIQIGTVTNSNGNSFVGEGITIDDSNIIVTFVDDNQDAADVTVITDNTAEYYTYVTVGDDTEKYDVTATNNDTTGDTSSSWTIALSEDAMTAIEAIVEESDVCSITLVIAATDDQGAYVGNAAGDDFPTYEGPVTASSVSGEETPYTFETDPFSGETVESLTEFTVQISGKTADDEADEFVELVDEDDIESIKVYALDENGDPEEDATTYVKDYDPLYYMEDGEETDYKYGFTFTFADEIPEGKYVIAIPAEFFMCGSTTNLSLAINTYVTVKQSVDYELTVTPVDGAEVDSIATIEILEANGQQIAWVGWESDITIVDEDGNTVATGINNSSYYEGNTITGENDIEIGYIIAFDDTIRTAGKYTIIIPEGTIGYGENGDDGSNEEDIKIEVTVSGLATGIKGVTLRATSDDKFYNLNGQRVTSPRNGVFILNGKKVLVK